MFYDIKNRVDHLEAKIYCGRYGNHLGYGSAIKGLIKENDLLKARLLAIENHFRVELVMRKSDDIYYIKEKK